MEQFHQKLERKLFKTRVWYPDKPALQIQPGKIDLAGWLGSHCKCLALSSESLHFGFSCGLKGGGGVKHGASPIGGKGRQGQTLGPSARLG